MKHKIVFIGDRPSSKNLDQKVPFVGTKSHSNLIKWTHYMGIPGYLLLNSHTDADKSKIFDLASQGFKCIALGNNSSKVLESLKIEHFKLPHPSPRNRLLNNKNYIDNELIKCKNYLNGILLKEG
jgi:uracil-DNA glycosylase